MMMKKIKAIRKATRWVAVHSFFTAGSVAEAGLPGLLSGAALPTCPASGFITVVAMINIFKSSDLKV
jgi:hypothetical protein